MQSIKDKIFVYVCIKMCDASKGVFENIRLRETK